MELPITNESKVYLGFKVASIKSFTTTALFFLLCLNVVSSECNSLVSDSIKNSILYFLDEISFIALATKSLYRCSNMSLVNSLGTPSFMLSEDIDKGSQLFIQVLKLTSDISLFIMFNVFSHS